MGDLRDLTDRATLGSGPLSPRFDAALLYAAEHHREQPRKGSRVPYLSHLLSVAALVLEHGGSEDAAIAALLHDAVEDAPDGTGPHVLADLRQRFGDEVAAVVRACSDSTGESARGSWAERKRAYVVALADRTGDAVLVTAADKTHNARCIAADLRSYGPVFWSTFRPCRHQVAWYYTAVEHGLARRLQGHAAGEALSRAVADLLQAARTSAPAVLPDPCPNCPS